MDIDKDFTISNIVGESDDDLKRYYYVTSGYINNKNIKEIRIEFSDDSLFVYKIGEGQKTYMDVKVGFPEKIVQITAFDTNSKVISPMKW